MGHRPSCGLGRVLSLDRDIHPANAQTTDGT
jgi:hypothetical protein